MKAAVYYGKNDIRVEERKLPAIGPDEMLMKMRACAVCGTDLRIYNHGHFRIPAGKNRVLGHEFAGEIVEVGSRVEGYTVGMRVVIPPNIGCGACAMCIQGVGHMCRQHEAFGITLDGGFQEYIRIPATAIRAGNVILLPDSLSYTEAAIIEPLSCCYNAYQALGTKPGDTVLVIGNGPIGALHVMVNKLAGATVIAAGRTAERLSVLQELGADAVINSAENDLKEEVIKQTNGRGADIIITACSVPELQSDTLGMAAVHGRINFFGGLPKGKEHVTLNTNLIHYKELVVLGTTGSSLCHFFKSLQLASSGSMNLARLVSNEFTIDETAAAFTCAQSGKGMKVLVINP